MERRLRVLKAIRGEAVDQVPKGELLIDQEFMVDYFQARGEESLSGDQAGEITFGQQVKFLADFDMDLISLMPQYQLSQTELTKPEELALLAADLTELNKWAVRTDYFVFGVVGGGFQSATTHFDFMDVLKLTFSNPQLAGKIFQKFTKINTEIAFRAVEAGADGIIIGDDIAYNQGTYIAPQVLRETLFPHLKVMVAKIKEKGVPVFFHADGDLNKVLADLVELGIDGIHSLQPAAKMDIGRVKREFGEQLCLMGNMDLDKLVPFGSLAEIEQAVKETMTVAKGKSRYIFGTCGAISKGLPVDKVQALYQAAGRWGKYYD